MPTLTGTLAYVTGQTVPPKAIRHVTVRATHTRTNGTELVTTRPVPVDHTGTLTLTLEPGTATLHVDLDTGHNTVDLLVADGMITLHEAAQAAMEAKDGN